MREREREQRGTDRQRHVGPHPGFSLAKVKAFASCQLETAACGQKDAALRRFSPLVSPVCLCVCVCVRASVQHGGSRVLRALLMC